jgi:hypothetical protein
MPVYTAIHLMNLFDVSWLRSDRRRLVVWDRGAPASSLFGYDQLTTAFVKLLCVVMVVHSVTSCAASVSFLMQALKEQKEISDTLEETVKEAEKALEMTQTALQVEAQQKDNLIKSTGVLVRTLQHRAVIAHYAQLFAAVHGCLTLSECFLLRRSRLLKQRWRCIMQSKSSST